MGAAFVRFLYRLPQPWSVAIPSATTAGCPISLSRSVRATADVYSVWPSSAELSVMTARYTSDCCVNFAHRLCLICVMMFHMLCAPCVIGLSHAGRQTHAAQQAACRKVSTEAFRVLHRGQQAGQMVSKRSTLWLCYTGTASAWPSALLQFTMAYLISTCMLCYA